MAYNATPGARTAHFASWRHAVGAIVHAQHSQTWSVHMFAVGEHNAGAGSLNFSEGGQQGGRNWCTCAQCAPSYAGRGMMDWCGQNQASSERVLPRDPTPATTASRPKPLALPPNAPLSRAEARRSGDVSAQL